MIDEQVQDAVSKGAKLLTGGVHKDGFYQPTVVSGVTREMKIFTDESFGPVTSIIEAADSENALAIANDTAYGLSSGVITNDPQKAMELA